MFRDFGVAEYLIQEEQLDNQKIRAALTVNIALSWLVGLLLFCAAPFASNFYGEPGIAAVMRIQAFSFLFIPFGAVTFAFFRREPQLQTDLRLKFSRQSNRLGCGDRMCPLRTRLHESGLVFAGWRHRDRSRGRVVPASRLPSVARPQRPR
jgi:hypothetical protein